MNKIKVGSDYSGVGAFNQSLKRLQIAYTECFACDLDKFARKTFNHPVHREMYTRRRGEQTRSGCKVIVPGAKTVRYEKSSIPSLARIINSF